MKWKCKRDLFMNKSDWRVFTKELEYEDIGDQKFEKDPIMITLRDDGGMKHEVSAEWLSNFEKIEENV